MEHQEDLGGRFLVAVEDVSGVWNTIKPALEAHGVLQNMSLTNKFGNVINVPNLPVQYILSTDPALVRLRPHTHSPVAWFRNPYAHLIVVSCEDLVDYRAGLRTQLRALLDRERDPVLGVVESIVLYVRPVALDVQARGPKKVFERLRDDFNTRQRRERCVRLDTPVLVANAPLTGPWDGLHELESFLKVSVRISFEARQKAYEEEVRRLMASRMEPGWSFPSLFLVKDSLAIMLDAAGLVEDSLREYYELEACYLEALAGSGALRDGDFGGNSPGDDVASLLTASWRETRRAILNYGSICQFNFRQFLFARQARLLLTLNRPIELAERAMKFVQTFGLLLMDKEAKSHLQEKFRQVWVFSACLSVASVTFKAFAPREGKPSQSAASPPPSLPSAEVQTHIRRRSAPSSTLEGRRQPVASRFSTEAAAQDDSEIGTSSTVENVSGNLQKDRGRASSREVRFEENLPAESTPVAFQRRLRPLKTISDRELAVSSPLAAPVPSPAASEEAGWGLTPSIDWDFGFVPELSRQALEDDGDAIDSAGPDSAPNGASGLSQQEKAFYCVLGHLFSTARSELLKLGQASGLQNRVQRNSFSSSSVAAGSPLTLRIASPSAQPTPLALPRTTNSAVPVELASPSDKLFSSAPASPRAGFSTPASCVSLSNEPSQSTSMSSLRRTVSLELESQPEITDMGGRESSASLSRESDGERLAARHSSFSQSTQPGQQDASLIKEAEALSPPPMTPVDGMATFAELELGEADAPSNNGTVEAPSPSEARSPGVVFASTALDRQIHANMPPWITEWRLKSALCSRDLYEELFLQLSIAAAHCYSISGRRRNATIIRSDVAALLLKTGRLKAATILYQRQAQVFAEEGWHALLGQTVPQLAACYKALSHPAYPHWLMKLLSLPAALMPRVDRGDMQKELEGACANAEPLNPELREALVAHLAAPQQHARSELCPDLCIHQGLSGAESVMDAVGALILSPAPGMFSHVYFEPRPVHGHNITSSGSSTFQGPLWTEHGELQCCLEEDQVINPGVNRLTFLAYPVQPGNYCLKHMTGVLGNMTICICAAASVTRNATRWALTRGHDGGLGLLAMPDVAVTPRGSFPLALVAPPSKPGVPTDTHPVEGGEVMEEQILLIVEHTSPRLGVSVVGFQGGLCAGQSQWMGICLRPARKTLTNATLQVWMTRSHRSSDVAGVALPKQAGHALVVPLPAEKAEREGEGGLGGAGRTGAEARRTEDEDAGVVAKDSQGAEATWVKVKGGDVKLPEWACDRPSLVWLWAEVSQPTTSPKELIGADTYAELELEVRYTTSGCNRSHSCVLSVPVFQPFRVSVAAHRLSSSRIAVEICLSSRLARPTLVRDCRLLVQKGLALECDWVQASSRLPALVNPEGSIKMLYFVRQFSNPEEMSLMSTGDEALEQLEQFTAFEADYAILPGKPRMMPAEVAGDSWKAGQCVPLAVSPPIGQPPSLAETDDTGGLLLSQPDDEEDPGSDEPSSAAAAASGELQTLRQCFAIDTGIKKESPEMVIVVRMLGPFSLAQGQTAHFCWKLERAGSPRGSKRLQAGGVGPSASDRGQVRQPTAAEDEGVAARTHEVLCDEVHYEITASSDSWRTGGTRRGQVWLPRRVGASATIEAAWTPLMEGLLPMPELQLHSVAWREGPSPDPSVAGQSDGGEGGFPTHCLVVSASRPATDELPLAPPAGAPPPSPGPARPAAIPAPAPSTQGLRASDSNLMGPRKETTPSFQSAWVSTGLGSEATAAAPPLPVRQSTSLSNLQRAVSLPQGQPRSSSQP